jgi:peroxiredoxin Q/BCP
MTTRRKNWLSALLMFVTGVAAAEIPPAGKPAPAFSLEDQNGKQVSLADFRGRWVVLYFYPKADTPGCTQEACKFRDDLAKLTKLGAQVLGVSVDDTTAQLAFAKKYSLPFPLLSDRDGNVARAYGALNDLKLVRFAKRYTFLIDGEGVLRKAYEKVDTSRHSTEIIADLEQMKGT